MSRVHYLRLATPGTLYLASEIKALLAAGVPARWDHSSFYQANHFLVTHQDCTLFEGINQVPPGHFLIATGGQVRLIRYWDFDYPKADSVTTGGSDGEYAARFREALDEAVRVRLRADVPVGCYLSGGIDSCAVLGLRPREGHRIARSASHARQRSPDRA